MASVSDTLSDLSLLIGRVEESLPYLEKAVALLPYDPVINDHLGDAYWRANRHLEARFQWARAKNYGEDKKLIASIDEKMLKGLVDTHPLKAASAHTPSPNNLVGSQAETAEEPETKKQYTGVHHPSLRVFSPAKINLALHVLGKRPDGYHTLHSLVMFANQGDWIEITPAPASPGINLSIDGPFAAALDGDTAHNSCRKAAEIFFELTGKKPNIHLRLIKNLPVASGMGGGSGNAAATLKALLSYTDSSIPQNVLENALRTLGADVPVCFYGYSAFISGTGEYIQPVSDLPSLPCVLVNPGRPCSTTDVFAKGPEFGDSIPALPKESISIETLCAFLKSQTRNDLSMAASTLVPEIATALNSLEAQKECLLARMSGSGATFFGLFATEAAAQSAQTALSQKFPEWWIQKAVLNAN